MHFHRILSLACLFIAIAEADVTAASLAAVLPLAPPCAVSVGFSSQAKDADIC
jgi:hypothetical protein